jgi:lipopolysaccharide export system protein LptA
MPVDNLSNTCKAPPSRITAVAIHWYPACLAALVAMLLAYASLATALPDDRNQEIHIESDRATREDKTSVSIYDGNVTITQGSIEIKADKVTIHGDGDKVSHIVCIGKPARYQQQPKPEDGLMVATASTIEYYLDTDIVHLIGDARVDQQGSTLQGQRIDYDLNKERVDARGDSNGKQRVRMVIPPGQHKGKD